MHSYHLPIVDFARYGEINLNLDNRSYLICHSCQICMQFRTRVFFFFFFSFSFSCCFIVYSIVPCSTHYLLTSACCRSCSYRIQIFSTGLYSGRPPHPLIHADLGNAGEFPSGRNALPSTPGMRCRISSKVCCYPYGDDASK